MNFSKIWWWRNFPFVKFDPETFTTTPKGRKEWPEEDEEAAWNYELARRVIDVDSPCYLDLPAWKRAVLWAEYCTADVPGVLVLVDRSKTPEGLPFFTSPKLIRWNLQASNEALVRQFLTWIEDERKEQGIRLKRNQKRARKVSWRWVELLDLSQTGQPLDAKERSKKAQALRRAKHNAISVKKVLAKTSKDYWNSLSAGQKAIHKKLRLPYTKTLRDLFPALRESSND